MQKMGNLERKLNCTINIQNHINFNNSLLKLLNEQGMHLYIHDLLNHKIEDKYLHKSIHSKNKEVHIQGNYHY